MTFSINVPNAADSPAIFPAQNNDNFRRIRDIVNNDHNWTDSAAAGQGIHKQVTLINRSTPMGLPAGNGILYSQADNLGLAQLFWYNGTTNINLSAGALSLSGSVFLTPAQEATIFADPGYSYQAYWWWGHTTAEPEGHNNGIAIHYSSGNNYTPGQRTYPPRVIFNGDDLVIINGSALSPSRDVKWTLQIIRFP